MSEDLSPKIEKAAQEVRSFSADGTNAQAVPIPEMIEADKYLKAQQAKTKNHLGLTFRKLVPGD